MTKIPDVNRCEDLAESHCRSSNHYNGSDGYAQFQPIGLNDPDWCKVHWEVQHHVGILSNLKNISVHSVAADLINDPSVRWEAASEGPGRAGSQEECEEHHPSVLIEDETGFLIVLELYIDVVILLVALGVISTNQTLLLVLPRIICYRIILNLVGSTKQALVGIFRLLCLNLC